MKSTSLQRSSRHTSFLRPCALFALLLLSACSQSQSTKLVLTGSSTVAPLASEIARAFESSHPGARIDVQSGGSSRGIIDARTGVAQIGMVSRALKASESDLLSYTIAYDGISIILNTQNPVQQLDDKQVVSIYQGKIDNWNQLGGPNQPITVVNKAEGRSTLELFLHYFKLNNRDIKADVVIGDNQQGIKTVAGNPWAIGYVSVGSAEYEAKHGAAIKLLGVGGSLASIAAVKTGQYPLSRPLNLVTTTSPKGLAKQFIEFAQSPLTHNLVEQQYFIPIDAN